MDVPERERALDTRDAMGTSEEALKVRGEHGTLGALHLAFVSDKDVVEEHAQ